MEIMSWGTQVDFTAGCSSCSMTSSFMTNAYCSTDRKSCELLTSASANLAQTTQYLDSWLSDLHQSELKMKSLKVEGHVPQWGHVPQCPVAGDATEHILIVFYFLIICTEVFLCCFQYMGSPYKRSIRLLGYYPSHII